MESNSNVKLATEKVCTGLCTTVAFLCYPFLQLENVESLKTLNEYTVLHNSNLEIRGFWPKALQIHCFLEKKSHLVHKYKPHEVRF